MEWCLPSRRFRGRVVMLSDARVCLALTGFRCAWCCSPAFSFAFTALPRCHAMVSSDRSPAQGRGRFPGIWVPVLCFLKLSASPICCESPWRLLVFWGFVCSMLIALASEVTLSDVGIHIHAYRHFHLYSVTMGTARIIFGSCQHPY